MTMNDEWYEKVPAHATLTQGDIVVECPVLSWHDAPFDLSSDANHEETLRASVAASCSDVVVMSQACDLEQNKIHNVILCPCLTLSRYRTAWEQTERERGNNPTDKSWRKMCESITSGYRWNLTILSAGKFDDISTEHLIVDFHEVFSIPRGFLESFLRQRNTPRLRLLPPYREHLSQAFARFFMRVGLPTPVEKAW